MPRRLRVSAAEQFSASQMLRETEEHLAETQAAISEDFASPPHSMGNRVRLVWGRPRPAVLCNPR